MQRKSRAQQQQQTKAMRHIKLFPHSFFTRVTISP